MDTLSSGSTLPLSLEGRLLEGQKLYSKISDADFDDDEDRERTLERASTVLEALEKGIAREAVFSRNEDLDEIATSTLPLLATEFYLGSLKMKLPVKTPQSRLEVLKHAEALLCKYLDTCDRLQLFDEDDRQTWESFLKKGESSPSGLGREGGRSARDQKIERFRRQRRMRERMDEIECELLRVKVLDCYDESGGDSMQRERALLLLTTLAAEALDDLVGISKELEMLEYLLSASEHQDSLPRKEPATGKRDEHNAAIQSSGLQVTHVSRVGGTLQMRKEEVRATVFKPTVAPPTMSVEEFGELQLQRAQLNKEVAGNTPSTNRRYDQLEMDGEEDDEDLVEQAVHHDREWDNWKDEHPRGSGNKANKII